MGRRQHCLIVWARAKQPFPWKVPLFPSKVARANVAAGPFCLPSRVDAQLKSRLPRGCVMSLAMCVAGAHGTSDTVRGHSFDADFELTRLAELGKTGLQAKLPRRSSPPVMAVDQPGCDRFLDRTVE